MCRIVGLVLLFLSTWFVSLASAGSTDFDAFTPEYFGPSDFITHCPLISPTVRPADNCASQGGGFDAIRSSGPHLALDLETISPNGVVFAAAPGSVVLVGSQDQWKQMGNVVVVEHKDRHFTLYGHLGQVAVTEGTEVQGGQKLGTIGYSGNAACLLSNRLPKHLHFAVFRSVAQSDFPQARPISHWKQEGEAIPDHFGVVGPLNPSRRLAAIPGCLH